jgi:hypothetical protein
MSKDARLVLPVFAAVTVVTTLLVGLSSFVPARLTRSDGPGTTDGVVTGRAQLRPVVFGYPSGTTPEPVPSSTAWNPVSGRYVGLSHLQIAEDLATFLVDAGWATEPIAMVDSVTVTAAEGGRFEIPSDEVLYNSPEDVALVLSGIFMMPVPTMDPMTVPRRYMLVVVDIYSGQWLFSSQADDLSPLLERLRR